MADKIRIRDSMPEILEKCDSIEEFERLGDPTGELSKQTADAGAKIRAQFDQWFWKTVFGALLDFERWSRLARTPRKFDQELNKLLAAIRKYMKLTYGIPSHRPAEHAQRDAKIYRLKKEKPEMTFGQIALKVDLTTEEANTVQRAYERYRERQKANLRKGLLLLSDLEDAQDSDKEDSPK